MGWRRCAPVADSADRAATPNRHRHAELANELAFGITADFDAVPDVEELSRDIERGLARLVAISDERLGSNATA
jgi:hypothetical protein